MTPAEQAKKAGLRSLKEVTYYTDVPKNTLWRWHRDKPKTFEAIVLGAVILKAKK